jgi:hypothetical protein
MPGIAPGSSEPGVPIILDVEGECPEWRMLHDDVERAPSQLLCQACMKERLSVGLERANNVLASLEWVGIPLARYVL